MSTIEWVTLTCPHLPAQHVGPAVLVRDDVALAAGSVARARPEEGVLAVAVVDEVVQHHRLVIHRVHVSADLGNSW